MWQQVNWFKRSNRSKHALKVEYIIKEVNANINMNNKTIINMQASNDDYDATTETTYVYDNSY